MNNIKKLSLSKLSPSKIGNKISRSKTFKDFTKKINIQPEKLTKYIKKVNNINNKNELYKIFEDTLYDNICKKKEYIKLNLTCIQGYILKLLLKTNKDKLINNENDGNITLNLTELNIIIEEKINSINNDKKSGQNIKYLDAVLTTIKDIQTKIKELGLEKIYYYQICINGKNIKCNDNEYNMKLTDNNSINIKKDKEFKTILNKLFIS
jgi:hypothetical protein